MILDHIGTSPERGPQRVRCGNGDGRRGRYQGVNADEAREYIHKSLRKKCMNIHLNSLGFQGF